MASKTEASKTQRRRTTARPFALLAIWLASCPTIRALDLTTATPPVEIADRQVTVGPRTVRLPAGDWRELDHYVWQASAGRAIGMVHSSFITRIEHGTIGLSGRIVLLKSDIPASSWRDQPCGGVEDIYVKDYSPDPELKDCLVVRSVRKKEMIDLLQRTFPNAIRWMANANMAVPDAAVRIRYARYSTNTYGIIDLFVPAEYFESEPAAIEWSESLRSSMKSLFEHRENEGTLPALPTRAEVPPSSSSEAGTAAQ